MATKRVAVGLGECLRSLEGLSFLQEGEAVPCANCPVGSG